MFDRIKQWWTPKQFVETVAKDISEGLENGSVTLDRDTADIVIENLIENIGRQEEHYLSHIFNLELMIKGIVMSNGGSLIVARDIMELVANSDYDLDTGEDEDGNLKLSIDEHVCEHCGGMGCGDEGDDE